MLHLTWLQKEVKSEWEKQVKKNRTERGKENWRINKILVGMKCSAPTSSAEPMFNNHFIKNYYISSSCPFTLEFLCERRSNALPTQWVLGNAGWDEGEQHPNFHQRPKQPFKFKSGKTQLILEAWCGPSTPLISILPIKLQCQMPLWSCRLWFHYPAEGWGEHKSRLSLFHGISSLLFQQGFLPCMSGSAACRGSGEPVLIFLGCTEYWPCISGALCLKGGWNIYSLAGRGRECRFLFPVTGGHLQS